VLLSKVFYITKSVAKPKRYSPLRGKRWRT